MAFESMTQAGKKFGSKFRRNRFDEYHAGKQPQEKESEGVKNQEVGTDKRAAHVHYSHDHENNQHHVTKTYEDGTQAKSVHSSAAEAYERGGEKEFTNVKREDHPDQQGARSEEQNYVQTETAS